jgi:hypothetical protein
VTTAHEAALSILDGVKDQNMNQEYRLQKAQVLATLALAEALSGLKAPEVPQAAETPEDPSRYVYALNRLLPDQRVWESVSIYTDRNVADAEADALNKSQQGVKWDVESHILRRTKDWN